jgi:arylsulfatase B
MATADHTPRGRGWQHHMIYFDGANDYWTSQSGGCGRAAVTDLWLQDAPAFGLNNSYSCSQAHQPASCVYEDAMFLQQTLSAIKNRDASRPYFQIWAPHNIHAPLQVPAAYLQNFSFIPDARRQAYAAKVRYVDDALAQVVAALKAAGMWENMIFVLSADNGGPCVRSRPRPRPSPRLTLGAAPQTPSHLHAPPPSSFSARAESTTMAARAQTTGLSRVAKPPTGRAACAATG